MTEPSFKQELEALLTAEWWPRREITVHWQVGVAIQTERFNTDDPGTWNILVVVLPGTELVVLLEDPSQSGNMIARISAESHTEETVVVDSDQCRTYFKL